MPCDMVVWSLPQSMLICFSVRICPLFKDCRDYVVSYAEFQSLGLQKLVSFQAPEVSCAYGDKEVMGLQIQSAQFIYPT
jgi:hypothetical protein